METTKCPTEGIRETNARISNPRLCAVCHKPVTKAKRGPTRKTCSDTCRQRFYRAKPVTLPPPVSKTCNTRVEGSYTASSIVILSEPDRMKNPAFDWELAEDLAHEFTKSLPFVQRGIAACREAGESPQYFIDRYLLKLQLPKNTNVDKASAEIQRWGNR